VRTYELKYQRLREAVAAYDKALRAYGLMNQSWVDSSELDRLWAVVLDAASLPPMQATRRGE